MSLPDTQPSRTSSGDKGLQILNAVMFFGLVLLGALFFVWTFVSSIGPAMGVLDRLSDADRLALMRPTLFFGPAVMGALVLWRGVARLLSTIRARR